MDMTSSVMWFSLALVFITVAITKAAIGRIIVEPVDNRLRPPPVLNGTSIVGLLHTLFTKGFRYMIQDQYMELGSVFTISFFGQKITFLLGPEVSGHFYQGPESELSHGGILEFTVPIFGKEIGYAVDAPTRNEQNRFYLDALKPSKLRCHVGPMLQEVEDYFAQWREQGKVDLKQELDQLLMVISSRCLLGKQVREMMMFSEVFSLFHELVENSLRLTSIFFPYAPFPANRRRDKARARLSEIFAEIVRSCKRFNIVEVDVLQNLINSKYKDGRHTTEAEVTGLIIALIFAGKHTSSATSTWTGTRLLRHTECMAAAIEEQQQIIKKYGDRIDYTILLEMEILHRCIKEALRLHPPTPMFLRKVHKNFNVRTKEGYEYEILRGHTLVSPLVFNHKIPCIYADPDVYEPNRFGPGREENRVGGKFSYTAFSGGRSTCPGEAYAYMQIKLIWTHLLRNFELTLVSPFTDWGKIASEPKGKVMVSYKRKPQPTN
ncbi:hypothetical protein ACP4OV_028594 [Aristida adscensionis]